MKIYTKVSCILLVATFLCLALVSRAFSVNPFLPNNPLCASKTLPNQTPFNTWITPLSAPNSLAGWCYIPAIAIVPPPAVAYLRIEELYDDQGLAGDVAGDVAGPPGYTPGGISYPGSAPFFITYPDGKVNMIDIAAIIAAFAAPYNVPPKWNYMADVFQDQKINMRDIMTAVAYSFGHTGTYFWPYLAPTTWDPAYSVTVQFFPSLTITAPDPMGVVPIPPGSTSYVVNILAGPVVGIPAPVVPGGPIGAIVTFWNVHP
jgi:hypothetical protein